MNLQQLWAILQLRWRLSCNQWNRAGTLNTVLAVLLLSAIVLISAACFLGALVGGYFLLPQAQPDHVLILWDVVAGAFLLFWMLGVLIELQRSELLSLDNLLHLPVTLSGAFLLNYLSSWFCLSLAVFLPLMIGLNLASVATQGVAMALLLPLIAGFLAMVTGVTYQFRGWLGRLMQNKRRRGTVIAAITISFMLLSQLPNLINLSVQRASLNSRQQQNEEQAHEQERLHQDLMERRITPQEYQQRSKELTALHQAEENAAWENSLQTAFGWARMANLILPVGWLPWGARALTQRQLWPALLGSAGMFAIGIGSLRLSYLGTMKAYTGSQRKVSQPVSSAAVSKAADNKPLFIARHIPWLSEQVSTIALASLCSVLRSSEGKMMMMSPLIFLGIFGAFFLLGSNRQFPEAAVPAILISSVGIALLSVTQFTVNSFGFDRSGFRAYILMPVRRRDILFGKNLGFLPLVAVLNLAVLCLLAWAMPVRWDHVLATLIQLAISYLLLCLGGNLLSILVPVAMAVGALKPQNPRMVPMVVQLLFTLTTPVMLFPAGLACGIELWVEYAFGGRGVPWYLLLSLIEAPLVAIVYWYALDVQGDLLHRRETRILEVLVAEHD